MLPNTTENLPSLPITHSDIRQVCGNEILASAGALGRPVSISYRGPPCQSFNIAGTRKGLEDERGRLRLKFAHTARETLPKGFVLENVKRPATGVAV